ELNDLSYVFQAVNNVANTPIWEKNWQVGEAPVPLLESRSHSSQTMNVVFLHRHHNWLTSADYGLKRGAEIFAHFRRPRVGRIVWEHVEQTTAEYLFPIRHRGPKVRVCYCNDRVILLGREHHMKYRPILEQALKIKTSGGRRDKHSSPPHPEG